MAAPNPESVEINIPTLPAEHGRFIEYVAAHPQVPMLELLEPYKQHDAELRKVFAQRPDHPGTKQPNVVPVFAGHEQDVKVRARKLDAESDREKESYIMPLNNKDRKPDGAPAIVQSLREFKTNFNVFSESSLADLDWSNVVVAGSAVVTSLLAVPEKHAESKRALRNFYHEQLAPASDVDLFLYDLSEDEAVEKIKQIERQIRDALLVETTTVRTKNAITIVSQYPVRHIQIVLRIYKSISEILTGFDVDCSCAAYDGKQLWASPRALAAYMTQVNTIDLTRRSPSYENRLSKYAKRGFEVYWPNLDRSKVDPTIFERSFGRTEGLARLLILEKLPKSDDRDAYLDQRRAERGRPSVNRSRGRKHLIYGNIKNDYEDEVAEWVDTDEVSDYHTFTIPYGPKFHARKIDRLLYTKDLLLNSEWNKPKDREVNLHRHPAFFGTAEDVIHDCCGYCPEPSTPEEEEAAEEEGKVYVSGDISFIKDNPGRQTIGSFHPLTADDWTEMAYVSNTGMLCQAIVDGDVEYVGSWLEGDGNDPNARDWTGRAPLHLAVANSTLDIVQLLIDHGARLVARLVDGRTALHIAAMRGDIGMVSALLRKSEANEEEEEKKTDARRAERKAAKAGTPADVDMTDAGKASMAEPSETAAEEEDSDVDMVEDADEDEDMDATTENSIVNIKTPPSDPDDKALANDDDDEPDVYDINVLAWDTAASPLHLAVINGHTEVVKTLVQDFGADLLLPIKLYNDHDKSARAAILTLVLALQLPMDRAEEMIRILIHLGASSAQADMDQTTVLQYCIADRPDQLDTLGDADKTGVGRAINHLSVSGRSWNIQVSGPLLTAIKAGDSLTAFKLLSAGAKSQIEFGDYMKAYQTRHDPPKDSKQNRQQFEKTQEQPLLIAVKRELPLLARTLVSEHSVDVNTLTTEGYRVVNDEYCRRWMKGTSVLDVVREKLKELRQWEPTGDDQEPPIPLKDDASCLSAYEAGTYALWSAQRQLNAAKAKYAQECKWHEDHVRRSEEDKKGTEEKRLAISKLMNELEQLETVLTNAGAKSFEELHPEIEKPENNTRPTYQSDDPKQKAFEVEFDFKLGDLTDEANERYIRLFEAAWAENARLIKELALTAWKDAKETEQPPLQIAVQDQHLLSPFAIVAMKGNFELASLILEIALAQYVPPDAAKQQRYSTGGVVPDGKDSEDVDSDSDSDDVAIYSEIVDDQFTIENIGEVSTQVKSRILPSSMMEWDCPPIMMAPPGPESNSSAGFSYFGPRKPYTLGKRTNTGTVKSPSPVPQALSQRDKPMDAPRGLIQLALLVGDVRLLEYLLSAGQEYLQKQSSSGDDSKKHFYTISEADFSYAIRADRPALLEEIIKRTGAGIPLNELVKKSGVEVVEKPKYYQGLSVNGKKRQDWADAGRGQMSYERVESHRPPLLEAAHEGSLKAAEWFLSDSPMRCYKEFAERNKGDRSLQRLAQAAGGFEASTKKFLDSRSHLAIHCCLMGYQTSNDGGALLRYLIGAMPTAIDAKSYEGLTPLNIAMELYDDAAVQILIEAGADQTTRDKAGNNVLHRLLNRPITEDEELQKLPKMLGLLDKRLLPGLWLERSSEHPGSLTPLARWLSRPSENTLYGMETETMQTLLRFSGGTELSQINGEGDTPLHVTVRTSLPHLTKVILDFDPTLLNRENATGRTPFEIAEDAAVADMCSGPPALPGNWFYSERRARREGLPSGWADKVIDRAPDSFVEKIREDRRTNREKVLDLVRETKQKLDAEGKAKRRIVTLNEANEVARRLAATKAGASRPHAQDGSDAGENPSGGDEVQAWLRLAKLRV